MSKFKAIRDRLKVTQEVLADGIGCTQGLVWQMEHGATVMPDTAQKLIAYAATKGLSITFDDIYEPPKPPKAKRAPVTAR
jgi:putative transcriptional regulator